MAKPQPKGRGPPGPQAASCQGPSLTEAQAWGSITWGSQHQETPLKSQGSFATMDSSSQDCITIINMTKQQRKLLASIHYG